jgi:hypothetical protein
MKSRFSKYTIITIMAFVGILLVVSTTVSNGNLFVNAQQQPLPKDAPEKGTVFVLMKRVDLQTNLKNVLNWQV